MAAKHKFQNARVTIKSSLPSAQLVDLARQVGESVTSKIPGQGFVRVEAVAPMSVSFSVRGLGGIVEQMRFNFNVLQNDGKCTGASEIVMFKTTQQRIMLIPVAPKSLLGWAQYKRFAANLISAVKAADATATCEFVERPVVGSRG